MDIFLNILFLIIGMVFLIKGADAFVDGASSIAKKLKVPSLIVGLTIVSLGTSLPELAVSFAAAAKGEVEMSVGNVVGSNLFNTLVVLGATALVVPIAVERKVIKFEIPYLFGVTILLFVASVTGEKAITWYYGLIFIILLVVYITFLIFRTKNENKEGVEEEEKPKMGVIKAIIFLILGGGAIALGGEVVNRTAVFLASAWGMGQDLIALTIVAMGTSLPELVTSLVAAKKGENDIALGNVIGSNTLNILFILGISSLIHPLTIKPSFIFDMIYLLVITIVLIIMILLTMKKKGLFRISGSILLLLYIIYMAYIICRNYQVLPSWLLFF